MAPQLCFVLLVFTLVYAPGPSAQQIILDEDFEDGDFTTNPEWVGDTDSWTIVQENDNHLLRLDAGEAGESHLSTASIANYGQWEFSVRLDGFVTSNQNQAHVFLLSDRSNSSNQASGYAVRIGESGSDKVFRIVRFDQGSGNTVIVSGETLIEQNTEYRIRVTRSNEGEWALFVAEGFDGSPQPEGSPAIDNTYAHAAWLSVRATYTVTRVDRFFFDDFLIIKSPLFLANVNVIDTQNFSIIFSEAIDPSSVSHSAFAIGTNGNMAPPDEWEITEPNVVHIYYEQPFPGATYTLQVEGIRDLAGGEMEPAEFIFDLVEQPVPADVVINEFFYYEPDNFPQYVELFNRSDKLLNLNNWRIQDNSATTRRLTTEEYTLAPGEYVVLTGNEADLSSRFGERNYLELSNFPSLNRASPDQIKIFSDQDVMIDSLFYDPPEWGGDSESLERRSAEAVSYARENWEESTHPLGGTPGEPNTTGADPEPLIVEEVSYSDSQKLLVRFNRHVDRISAEELSNYELEGVIVLMDAEKSGFNEVTLSLNPGMASNTSYTLSISRVESIFGVPMPEQSLHFTYYRIDPVGPAEVVVNEFMYNVALDFSRYIELYNSSSKALDLQGWTSNNDTGTRRVITNENTLLPPDSYIILAPDDTLLELFPDLNLINMGSRFSALKLGGDDIVIRAADGMLIDSLRYLPSWGGHEVALERRSLQAPAYYRENWGDSPSPNLGTPGEPNQIAPDLTPPTLISATASAQDELTLVFSKSMDPRAAETISNYQISPAILLQQAEADKEVVRLSMGSPFEPEQDYQLSLNNLSDIFANELESVSISFSYLEFEPAEEGDIIINEFVYRPASGETPRFVELYNRSERNINLQEWRLGRSLSSIQLDGPGGILPLPAGAYLVVSDQPELLNLNGAEALQLGSMLALSQNGDSVYLQSEEGLLIDSLSYTPDWGGSPAGYSLERRDPLSASNDSTNWLTHPQGHSAGRQNDGYAPNETPPDVLYAKRTAEGRYEVRFSEFVQPGPDSGFELNGAALQLSQFDVHAADRVLLSESSDSPQLFSGEEEIISISTIQDVPGNESTGLSIPIAQPLLPGDVVINEIMFQPFRDSSNDFPDQSEYVEFVNTQEYAIDMEGFYIHDQPDRDGLVRAIHPVTTESAWIAAGSYVVMYADPQQAFIDSRIARFFELQPSFSFFRADRGTLSLSTTEDAVYLSDSQGVVIDSVYYSSGWHNPNLVDTRGIALERINPDGESNEGTNWGSNVVSRGGTPGSRNSLYQIPGERPETEGIIMDPNPFSPDGDGQDDHLFVHYTLDEPDYLLRVRIFDRYGRLVKTLADGLAAGFEGTLTWDGRRDNGMENRIGIYIVLLEAYNSSSGSNRNFRETVVLARQL